MNGSPDLKQKLIVGNWKMNASRASVKALLAGLLDGGDLAGSELVVCAPYPYLALCAHLLAGSPIRLGAQDVSGHQGGAYTGEVSAAMLRDFGCCYVLIGHSERRAHHNENNEAIAAKIQRALGAGLIPIVCVGEVLRERQRGNTEFVLRQQVDAIGTALSRDQMAHIVVAYEPVWAIGTGISASPEIAQHAHAAIRHCLSRYRAGSTRILYGGSMKADNAAQLLAMPDVDGALVGGASLESTEFLAIARYGADTRLPW